MDDCITQLSEEDSGMERKKPHRLAISPKILTQTIRNILDAAQGKSLAEVSYFGNTHINQCLNFKNVYVYFNIRYSGLCDVGCT